MLGDLIGFAILILVIVAIYRVIKGANLHGENYVVPKSTHGLLVKNKSKVDYYRVKGVEQ